MFISIAHKIHTKENYGYKNIILYFKKLIVIFSKDFFMMVYFQYHQQQMLSPSFVINKINLEVNYISFRKYKIFKYTEIANILIIMILYYNDNSTCYWEQIGCVKTDTNISLTYWILTLKYYSCSLKHMIRFRRFLNLLIIPYKYFFNTKLMEISDISPNKKSLTCSSCILLL